MSEAGSALEAAARAEYQQRRRVESLRRRIYSLPDPSQSPELGEELVEIEHGGKVYTQT